jgi:two-component system, OmpR family, heavy metal sensor histidine kinase CusS
MRKRLNIRWKMTLWYGGVLASVLTVFGSVTYLMMRHHLLQRIDQGLHEELADVLSEVKRASTSGGLKEMLDRRFGGHEGFDFQVTRATGERFFANPRLTDKALPLPNPTAVADSPNYMTAPIETAGHWRIVSTQTQGPDGFLTVQVGRSLDAFEHESRELLLTFLLAGPLTLLAAISGGYFLARRALQPVQSMAHTARQISAERLNQRLPVVNPDDELGSLAETLNHMIERLERSFKEMQRFTADAAHELRTPLAVIRNEAEVALRAPRTGDDYCHVLENLLEETDRLSGLADQLLFLCRNDAGLSPQVRDHMALDELLREVVGNMQVVAQDKQITLTLAENPACPMTADPRQLRRVFYNLIDNAIKYTNATGRITVSNRVTAEAATVLVSDSGTGIAPEHLPRVFDRFYRVDPSRTGDANGAGLGLSICQSIVRGYGGTIAVESTLGKGTTITVQLPREPFISG